MRVGGISIPAALADEILADLEANGAYVTREDFASYQAEPGVPVEGRYRGYVVRSNNPPGSGVTVIQILQILEHFDLADGRALERPAFGPAGSGHGGGACGPEPVSRRPAICGRAG